MTTTMEWRGATPPGNSICASKSDAAFRALYNIHRDPVASAVSQEAMRTRVFMSCWNRARSESWRMWNGYGTKDGAPTSESVVITSSVKALCRFLPDRLRKSAVRYHPNDFPRSQFGHTTIFFYKPESKEWENEFRLLHVFGPDEVVDEQKYTSHRIPLLLNKIIHRVITHPKASLEFKARIDALLMRHLPGIRRQDSALP